MTQTQELIEAISKLRFIPPERDLWDSESVASYLKRSISHTMNHIVVLPDFPSPIRLPNGGKGKTQPLWKASEVMSWAESYKVNK